MQNRKPCRPDRNPDTRSTDYQNATYAGRYQALFKWPVRRGKHERPGPSGFTLAVARFAYKLMA
ncbi:MAG: hypothetical protein Ct9H300mP16_07780 [Pseudomonadota bacterium]|nr:MAG: hypothetical protein Ct9H300mP16_07780 [Pseudomonadota bacterium]